MESVFTIIFNNIPRLSFINNFKLSRSFKIIIDKIFNEFYKIPILESHESYSKTQIELLRYNYNYFQFHSSWFISISIHNCIDTVNLYSNCYKYHRKSCIELKCPPLCNFNLDIYDKLILLTNKNININDLQRNLILKDLNDINLDWILFLLLENKLIKFLNLKTPNHKITYQRWYLIQFLYDKRTANENTTYIDRYMIQWMYNSFICCKKILFEPNIKITNAKEILYPLIDSLCCDFGIITDNQLSDLKISNYGIKLSNYNISIIRTDFDIIKIKASYNKNIKEYFIITDNFYTIYRMSLCLQKISELCKIRIPTVKAILGDSGIVILELPEENINTTIEQYQQDKGIEYLAAYIAYMYLFGIYDKYTFFSSKGMYSIGYKNIYQKNKIRLGKIILVLGGRNSNKYKDFINVTIEYLIKIRKYYKISILYLYNMYIKRELIDIRFMPQLSDDDARIIYNKILKDNSDRAMRATKYIGF